MESTEADIKLTIPVGDTPDKTSLAVSSIGKLKQSRYEDVWPEDVHAAFMEAVALYPPMGKRRLKYYRVSTHENEHLSNANRAKSFGRCQLIQSYILEKTGKNRTRKQVSSHLQRLKKIHKDNPAMLPLFSDCSQPPLEHFSVSQASAAPESCQHISTNIPVTTRHLRSDPDLAVNLQNTDTGATSSPMLSYASLSASSYNALSLSTNFHDQPFSSSQELLSPVPQQFPAVDLRPSDSDYLSELELQDALLFKDAINEGFRSGSAFNTSALSISMRRLASKLPIQGRPVDTSSAVHFSRAVNTPGLQPTHQWTSHDNLMNAVSPLTQVQEAFHIPFLPLHLIPAEKRPDPGLASEWIWPKNPDVLLGPREGSFGEIRLRYAPAVHQYSSTYPEIKVDTPGSYFPLAENEASRLSKGISYSCAATSPTATRSVSNGDAINFPRQSPESSEKLAPHPVISPMPVYPTAYIHSDIHSNIHFDGRTPAPSLPP